MSSSVLLNILMAERNLIVCIYHTLPKQFILSGMNSFECIAEILHKFYVEFYKNVS
jgi:hypothetical protein